MENSSDRKLIADYLKGDEKSLEILIGRYLRPVYGFICRWVGNPRDAEDITQEVFVKAWRNLNPVRSPMRSRIGRRLWRLTSNGVKGFDPRKGNFRTWIFGIARNASIDFLRKTRSASGGKKEIPLSEFSDPEGGNAVADTIADPGPLPSEFFERVDASRVLAAALEKLSPKYRMVLYLRYNDHLNFREIGEALADFNTLNQADIVATASSIVDTFTILLGSIAAISLLVGGIGIMNMMLTTVTERTREIGLRKAIGAKRRDINTQFLAEAVMLTFIGGAAGIFFGWLIALGISQFGGVATEVSSSAIALAFGVSATIGIIFGYYPARKAARLNPIEALRYE